jgi:hypothetical protein
LTGNFSGLAALWALFGRHRQAIAEILNKYQGVYDFVPKYLLVAGKEKKRR